MRSFLQFIVKYPLAIVLVVALMALTGIYAAMHMSVDLFPNLEVPVVKVVTHYPAAAPEDLELLITRPIEDEMRTISGVKRVASVSAQGISQVTVEFTWGMSVNAARQAVEAKLGRVGGALPGGVLPRLESIGTTLQEVAGYVIYGPADQIALRNAVAHDVVSRLMSVDGVSSVDVLGGDRRAFIVRVRTEALARLRLTVGNIVEALRQSNLTSVSGYLDRSGREYLIRGDGRLNTLDDVRSVPVKTAGDESVLLGSVAEVSEGHAPKHYAVRGNGVPAVALVVHKQPGASTVKVVRGVEAAMADLRRLLPSGTHVAKYYDQSEIISEAWNEIIRDLALGTVLAVLVLYFFLGSMRPTAIVAITIPITLLATVAFMGLFGLSLNVITMTALALAIGMLVDGAVVVAENIHRHRLETRDEVRASIDGALQIAGPNASGVFTTVAAFIPLLLVTGLASLFLKPFGLTISTALIISLVLSQTLVPTLFSRMRATLPRSGFPGAKVLGALNAALQGTLRFSFRHRAVTLTIGVLFLCLAGLAAFLGKVALLPPIDEGAMLIEYVMPPGTSLSESNRVGEELVRIALADPDVADVYRRTGSPEIGYQIEGVNMGEMTMKLSPKAKRQRSLDEIMDSLKAAYSKIQGVAFLYHQPTQEKIDESFSGLPAVFGVTVYGTDLETLTSLAGEVEDVMARDPAVTNIVNNTKVKAPQLTVRLDYPKLAQHGVSAQDVLATLQAARFGVEATQIVRQKETVTVLVTTGAAKAQDVSSIETLPVATAQGAIIPLNRVADITVSHLPASITRLNGQREITLLAELNGSIGAAISRLREAFRTITLPADYSIDFTGQYKVLAQTVSEMIYAIMAALVLIFIIMAMQFRSWLQPLIILITVPVSLVGAIIALAVTRQGLNVSVAMGVVTLIGISVNNAIVLLDYANKSTTSGTVEDALLSAVSVRLRPVLLTSLTTIAALLPAAIGMSVGSKVFQSFAVTVIGGLISGTLGTLIIVPTLVVTLPHRSSRAGTMDS